MNKRILSVFIVLILIALAFSVQAQSGEPSVPPSAPEGETNAPQHIEADSTETFIYQGQLKDNAGNPVNAACDFRFRLWNSPAASGVQMGGDSLALGVIVSEGYFTTEVNGTAQFGPEAFTGRNRWLEVGVRCPAGSGAYTSLSPRQPLKPAPIALSLPGLYTQQDNDSPNIIGGYAGNIVDTGVQGATISGGGLEECPGDASSCANQIGADFGAISGGLGNLAGDTAAVGGGMYNEASGGYAAVSGGYNNQAGGYAATAGGGAGNRSNALHATVGGGMQNQANYEKSTISGGANNIAGANYATVAGGHANEASGVDSAVGGGYDNEASGNNAIVGGGYANVAASEGTTIGGGPSNAATSAMATVGGGYNNEASGSYAVVGGGYENFATFQSATVSGGEGNYAISAGAAVGGGNSNTASGENAVISGGYLNATGANNAAVGGGRSNEANALYSMVGGGYDNTAGGQYSAIGGGESNVTSGLYSTIPGGYDNTAAGNYSFAAGNRAQANHAGAFVWADSTTANFASTTANQFLIRAGGGVGIGTNSTQANGLTVNGRVIAGGTAAGVAGGEPFVARGGDSGISMDDRAGGTNPRWVIFPSGGALNFWNGSYRFLIDSTGIATLGNVGSGGTTTLCRNSFAQISNCSSSARYKQNITSLSEGLDVIEQLRPVAFNWTANDEADLGLVAEEVAEIEPLLVTYNAAGEVEGVKYDRVSAVLVNAVQEQQAQIAALEAQVAALKEGDNGRYGTTSPLFTPWPWLALCITILGLAALFRRGALR
jgi:trimeric autotransporter adhesin